MFVLIKNKKVLYAMALEYSAFQNYLNTHGRLSLNTRDELVITRKQFKRIFSKEHNLKREHSLNAS